MKDPTTYRMCTCGRVFDDRAQLMMHVKINSKHQPLLQERPRSMTMTLTRKQLDEMQCGNPDCASDHEELHISPKCHLEAPHYAVYHKKTGTLSFYCAVCHEFIVNIAVREED